MVIKKKHCKREEHLSYLFCHFYHVSDENEIWEAFKSHLNFQPLFLSGALKTKGELQVTERQKNPHRHVLRADDSKEGESCLFLRLDCMHSDSLFDRSVNSD